MSQKMLLEEEKSKVKLHNYNKLCRFPHLSNNKGGRVFGIPLSNIWQLTLDGERSDRSINKPSVLLNLGAWCKPVASLLISISTGLLKPRLRTLSPVTIPIKCVCHAYFSHMQLPCFLCSLQMTQWLKIIGFFSPLTPSFGLLPEVCSFQRISLQRRGQGEISPASTSFSWKATRKSLWQHTWKTYHQADGPACLCAFGGQWSRGRTYRSFLWSF